MKSRLLPIWWWFLAGCVWGLAGLIIPSMCECRTCLSLSMFYVQHLTTLPWKSSRNGSWWCSKARTCKVLLPFSLQIWKCFGVVMHENAKCSCEVDDRSSCCIIAWKIELRLRLGPSNRNSTPMLKDKAWVEIHNWLQLISSSQPQGAVCAPAPWHLHYKTSGFCVFWLYWAINGSLSW